MICWPTLYKRSNRLYYDFFLILLFDCIIFVHWIVVNCKKNKRKSFDYPGSITNLNFLFPFPRLQLSSSLFVFLLLPFCFVPLVLKMKEMGISIRNSSTKAQLVEKVKQTHAGQLEANGNRGQFGMSSTTIKLNGSFSDQSYDNKRYVQLCLYLLFHDPTEKWWSHYDTLISYYYFVSASDKALNGPDPNLFCRDTGSIRGQ